MGLADNKEAARRIVVEAWGNGDDTVLDELCASDVIDHNPAPGQAAGLQGQKDSLRFFRAAFDMDITLDLLVAEGDFVADRWTANMTHKGAFLGIPPTGKTVVITGLDISRFENGKVRELWHMEDQAGLMQQLGAMPAQGTQPVGSA